MGFLTLFDEDCGCHCALIFQHLQRVQNASFLDWKSLMKESFLKKKLGVFSSTEKNKLLGQLYIMVIFIAKEHK